jgi:hypothetical protein
LFILCIKGSLTGCDVSIGRANDVCALENLPEKEKSKEDRYADIRSEEGYCMLV